MLRFFIGLLLLTSCSLGVIKKGGERRYSYDPQKEYTTSELQGLSPQVVTTLTRDPQTGTLKELFSKKQAPLKRIGIMVFESIIQTTRGGLSGADKVYMSASGKQILAENFLRIWEQSFPILGQGLEYVSTAKLKKAPSFKKYGTDVEDHVKAKRSTLAPDDVYYIESGKNTTSASTLTPRGLRDYSLVLIPAGELLQGPKFSEHAKHAVNDLAKDLNLDAVIIVMNQVSWTASHTDKHSGVIIPEEVKLKIEATTLIPMGAYHKRLKKMGERRNFPKISVAFSTYESAIQVPVMISVESKDESFESIEKNILNPLLKSYSDLTHMTLIRMIEDMKIPQ